MRISQPFFQLSFALAAIVHVAAQVEPHDQVDWSQHQFQAPSSNDSRGPCPGLNTLVHTLEGTVIFDSSSDFHRLANHGFLPRNGRNLTIGMFIDAGKSKLYPTYQVLLY